MLIETLGDHYCYLDCGDSGIIKYGWYAFFYHTDSDLIYGIQNDHLLNDCINYKDMFRFQNDFFKIDSSFLEPPRSITLKEMITLLKRDSIPFSKEINIRGGFHYLRLKSGVIIDFSDQMMLNGIRLFQY